VADECVLDGELVQAELGRDGTQLVFGRTVHADPREPTSVAQRFESLVEGHGTRLAHALPIDGVVDDGDDRASLRNPRNA